MMEQREMLIELLDKLDVYDDWLNNETIADLLIANGVVVLPCRCEDCVLHRNCIPEDSMMICGIKDGYCAAGKRKGGDE